MGPYWRRVLVAAWFQTVEWFRWGSWPQFVLRAGSAIVVIFAIGWLSGPLAALATIGRTIAGVVAALILFVPVYLAAIVATSARLDRDKDAKITELQQAIAAFNDRTNKQAAVNALARLRSEGVAIMSDRPNGSGDVPRWHARWADWGDQVVAELTRHFTEAEMLSFRHLGSIPAVSFGAAVDDRHNHYLMQLDRQLSILQKLIDQNQERR